MQTKVIFCNSANKSCLLQVVHTKAIAALTQFCDFFYLLSVFCNLLFFVIWCFSFHLLFDFVQFLFLICCLSFVVCCFLFSVFMLEVGGWRLKVGGWKLVIRGWRLEIRD